MKHDHPEDLRKVRLGVAVAVLYLFFRKREQEEHHFFAISVFFNPGVM